MAASDQTVVMRPPRVPRGGAKGIAPKPQAEDPESTTRRQAGPAPEEGAAATNRAAPRGAPAPRFPPLQANRITEKLSAPPIVPSAEAPEAPRPIPEQETRRVERQSHWSPDLVALLGCALRKDAVLELLQGLSVPQRGPALGLAKHLLALDSGTRKARLAREFGERLDGSIRLRSVMAGCAGLEADLWRRLPPHHQRSYPRLQGVSEGAPNPVRAILLERLLKETLR